MFELMENVIVSFNLCLDTERVAAIVLQEYSSAHMHLRSSCCVLLT